MGLGDMIISASIGMTIGVLIGVHFGVSICHRTNRNGTKIDKE